MCLYWMRSAHCHLEEHQHRFVGCWELGDDKGAHLTEITLLRPEISTDNIRFNVRAHRYVVFEAGD